MKEVKEFLVKTGDKLVKSAAKFFKLDVEALKLFLLKCTVSLAIAVISMWVSFKMVCAFGAQDYVSQFFARAFSIIIPPLLWAAFVKCSFHKMLDTPVEEAYDAKDLQYAKNNEVRGIVFGKNKKNEIAYSPIKEETHVLVTGATGCGKTSAFCIPTLKSWMRQHTSVFAIDIAGDITKNVIGNHGKDSMIISFNDNDSTDSYDVFYEIDREHNKARKTELFQALAYQLMPNIPNAPENAQYFIREGRNLLTAAIMYYYDKGLDFVPICRLIVNATVDSLISQIMTGESKTAQQFISGFLGTDFRAYGACKQDCDEAIRIFAVNDIIEKVFHRVETPCRGTNAKSLERANVFIKIPENRLDIFKKAISIIVTQTVGYLSNRDPMNKKPILIMLDEFARLNEMPEVKSGLMTLRKRKVRICICVQSIQSLYDIYGQNGAAEIMDCCAHKLVMKINNAETQEMFSRMMGDTTEIVRSYRREAGVSHGYITKQQKKRRFSPESLGFLDNEAVLITPHGVVKLKNAYYFENSF